MALEFKLPDIGEGVAEGEIVKWLVQPGDTVQEHQSIVEVMTDKATVEIPSPAAGKISEILAKEGEVVPVGKVIFKLETGKATAGEGAGKGAVPSKKVTPATQPVAAAGATQRSEERGSRAQPPLANRGNAAPRPPAKEPPRPAPREQTSREQAPRVQPAGEREPARKEAAPRSGGGRLEFKLPDVGEGVAEGEIVKWLVAPGDTVKEHQAIVEVMTDKATVEIPAPAAGKIVELRAEPGQVVPVGAVLFVLETAGTGAGARPSVPQAQPRAEREPARGEGAHEGTVEGKEPEKELEQAGEGAGEAEIEGGIEAETKDGAAAGSERELQPAKAPAKRRSADEKVLAVPSARRVAREFGLDLAEVQGTGRNGVVRRADVEEYARARESTPARELQAEPARKPAPARQVATPARAGAAPAPRPAAAGERETRIPLRGIRRKIAEAMVRSKFTAPHFTVVEEVDVTDLVKLREQAKQLGSEEGVKVTFMPFLMKATALALAKHPMLNGRFDEEKQEIVRYGFVDLGIAMDTDNGLIVPVVREVQSKGLLQLAVELNELAERTRAGKVRPEELKGSTFSITNAGNIGGILATPIINYPEIAILGVHRIVKRPGVIETPKGDEIAIRQYMNLSCSVDHRLADGADGARFLVYLKRLLENPGLLAL